VMEPQLGKPISVNINQGPYLIWGGAYSTKMTLIPYYSAAVSGGMTLADKGVVAATVLAAQGGLQLLFLIPIIIAVVILVIFVLPMFYCACKKGGEAPKAITNNGISLSDVSSNAKRI